MGQSPTDVERPELSSQQRGWNRWIKAGILGVLTPSVSSGLKQVLRICADRIFPPVCGGCDGPVSNPGTLCGECWPQVMFFEAPLCPVMGTPFTHDFGEKFLSAEAIADPPPFSRVRSAVLHDGVARHMAVSLKYYDRLDLGRWMGLWMMRAGKELLDDCDIIIPVPLHRKRLRQRRYNQAAELARVVARLSDKPYAPVSLIRVKDTEQQARLSSAQRLRNVAGAFAVPEAREIDIRGRRVLLIDDVYTTGATVKAATRELLRAGAEAVDVLTFSRTLPERMKIA